MSADSDVANYRPMRDGVEVTGIAAGTTSYVGAGLGNDTTHTYTPAALDTHDNRSVLTSQALESADTNRLGDLYAKDLAGGAAGSPLG